MAPEMNFMLFVLGTCISSVISKQFIFINEVKTFDDAQIYCRRFHSDLASVEDSADFSLLQDAVSGITDPAVWIGLKKGEPDWFWSLFDSTFYGEGEAKYRRWRAGQLDNSGGNEDCCAVDGSGEFWDLSCSFQLAFICYDGNALQRYVLVNQGKSWSDAQMFCRQTYTDLVSVRNLDENQQVQNLVPRGKLVYIGLFKDVFRWTDNSGSSFRRWSVGEPDDSGACVAQRLSDINTWADQNCDETRRFICQDAFVFSRCSLMSAVWTLILTAPIHCRGSIGVKMQIQRVKLKSGQNVNDPVMKASIMEKIQQKLVSLGMPKNAKLQWRVQSDGEIFHPLGNKTESQK